jgi:hypothetical protein
MCLGFADLIDGAAADWVSVDRYDGVLLLHRHVWLFNTGTFEVEIQLDKERLGQGVLATQSLHRLEKELQR